MQNWAKTKGLNPFKSPKKTLVKESGNVFLMLFGAVAMVGVLGASTMTILKGPVRTMSQVTKQTLAENNAITTARLSISSATIDCDGDGVFEPLEFGAAIPGFTGGGQIPGALGVSRQDPWGNEYGYCVWDNATVDDGGCGGATQGRLAGDAGAGPYKEYVIAVVSAGPNGNYDTSCNDYAGAGTQINKAGDDIVFGYAYDDAASIVGGIWTDVGGGVGAEIGRDNITVRDTTVAEDIQFAIDTAMKTLTLGDGSTGIQGAAGIGKFPRVEADFLQSFNNANIGVLAPIASDSNITTTANISGANLAASGTLGVTGVSTLGTVVAGATSTSTLSSSGLATLNSLSVTNNGAIGGTFDVTGLSTFTGTANFDGDMRLGSDAADTIDVQGTMTIDTLSVTNNATIGGTLGVTGNTLLSTLTTSGLASLNSATMAGTIDMNSNTIIDVPDPANPLEVANKQYVDAEIAAVTSGGVTEDDPFVEDVLNTGELCIGKAGNIVGCDVTTVTSFETDPTIGTVTDGELCAWNNSTSKIECNTDPSALTTAETDPQVEDTLNAGELCIGKAGNIVGCDITAVTSFETDPTISTTVTSGELCTWNGTQIQCNTATGSVGAPGLFTDNTTYITRENFNIIDSGQTSTTTLLDGNGGATAGAFYDPNKYALRGGEITGTDTAWTDANIGIESFAWGQNAQASGDNSAVIGGDSNTASGLQSVVIGGQLNNATGTHSATIGGQSKTASGFNSLAFGHDIRVGSGAPQTTNVNTGVGNYSVGFGLGESSTGTFPQVSGNESAVFFFGDQQGEDITATNVLALEGGSLLLSNDSGSACAMAKQGALRLNATATGLEICSGVSWGPLTAVAAGSSDRIQDTGNNTSIDVDTDGLGGDDTIVFTNNAVESMRITADGDVVIGDTTASLTLLLDVAGQIGATEYCDADGLNCFDHTDIGASVDWDRIVNAMTLDTNTTIDMNTNTATLLFDNTDNLLFIDGANNNIAIGSTTVSGTLALDITGDIGATSYCDADGLNCFVPTDVGAELFTDNTTYITRENFHILDAGQTSTTASLDGDGLRSFYDPDKAAFRGGLIFAADDAWQDVNIGNSSFTWGHNSEASNTASVSFGIGNTASGEASFVTGRNSTATANSAITLGNNSDSTGFQSISIGDNLTSSNNNSVTIGTDSQAQGRQSITLGSFNRASGFNSFAFGHNALAGSGIPQSNDLSADAGNYSMAFGLGNASTASLPQVSGNESAAFFFGDQQGEDITATNVLALEGGSLLLSNDSGTACAAAKQGALRLNAGGTALEMCDGAGSWNAYPAPGGAASELADANNDTRIQVDTSGTGTDNRTVFTNNGSESMRITSDGDVVIGTTTPSLTLTLDVAGQIGATEYCDENGLNCFATTDMANLWAAGAGDDIYYNTGTPEVGIGTTSPDTILHVSSDTDDILLENNSTASPTAAMDIELNRSRAGGAVLDGDKIGGIKFEAIGSTSYETGAAIFAIVDGTPGNNDMPSRLEFHVADDGGTVSGSSIPTITISSDDHVGINDTDPDTYFEVAGSASVIGNLMMVSSDPDGDGDILMIEENGQIGINDATPNGTLMLDVDGQIGASEYCDNDGLNCVDAINIAGFWTDNTTHISRENFNIIRPTSNTTAAGLDVDGEYVFYDESNIAMRGGTITGGNAAWQDVNIGRHSFAWGRNVQASGIRSFAFGTDSIASNSGAFAMGINATASEANAISIGDTTDASADNAIAMGHDSIASGVNSNVLGFRSEASGLNSMVFGSEAKAGDGTPGNGTGDYSIAFGLGDVNGGFSTQPEITGTETMAIFFGDQQNESISATNVLALEGGSLLLSNDSGSACAANKDGALRLNATSDGLEMCDGAITTWVAFSGLWASGAGDDIYYDTGASQVGIGTSTPGAELDVVGDIQYTGVITDVSDRRLKENIQRLTSTNMLDQLIKIDGYTFQMIDRKNTDAIEYGVIAQEMEKIFPTLVHTDTTEGAYKSVNYTGLITPIIEAIKELYNMVLDLKDKVKIIFDKISKLENENSQLRVEVDTLKQQNQDILKRLESIEARTSNDNKEASLGIKTHANGT